MEIDKKLLRALVADGDVDALLTELLNIADRAGRTDWQNHLLQISANWNAGQKQYLIQTISHEQFRLERAQVINTLNQFINSLPDGIIAQEYGVGAPIPVSRPGTGQKKTGIYLIASITVVVITIGLAYAFGLFDRHKTPDSILSNTQSEPAAQKAPSEIKSKGSTPIPQTKPVQEGIALFNADEKTDVGIAMVSGHERNIDLAQKIAALLRQKGITASPSILLNTFYKQPYFYALLEGNHAIITRMQSKSHMRYVLLVRQNDVVIKEKVISTGPVLARESSSGIKTAEATFDILLLDTTSGKALEQAHPLFQAATLADLDQMLLDWIGKKNWSL